MNRHKMADYREDPKRRTERKKESLWYSYTQLSFTTRKNRNQRTQPPLLHLPPCPGQLSGAGGPVPAPRSAQQHHGLKPQPGRAELGHPRRRVCAAALVSNAPCARGRNKPRRRRHEGGPEAAAPRRADTSGPSRGPAGVPSPLQTIYIFFFTFAEHKTLRLNSTNYEGGFSARRKRGWKERSAGPRRCRRWSSRLPSACWPRAPLAGGGHRSLVPAVRGQKHSGAVPSRGGHPPSASRPGHVGAAPWVRRAQAARRQAECRSSSRAPTAPK